LLDLAELRVIQQTFTLPCIQYSSVIVYRP
jgi:hypothetical protein